MALTFGFYNSLDGDRRYDTVQISQIFDGIINDGIFQSIGDFFATKPSSGLSITVGTGRAWFDHTWTLNDALIPLTVDVADPTLTRIDAVVLEVDSSELVRANSIKIVKGTAASDPVKPVMTNTDTLHQHPLAYITVKPGMTEIKASEIEVMVGKSECPFVTAILETTDIDAVFAQWESQFTAWFENVQAQLEGDIATNLQRQIDTINQKSQSAGVFYKEAKPYAELQKWDGTKLKTPEGWQVGDVLSTARKNLGASWLLCNGDKVTTKSYPKLSELMAYNLVQNLYDSKTIPIDTPNASSYNAGPFYLNGRFIIIHHNGSNGLDFFECSQSEETWRMHSATGIIMGDAYFSNKYVDLQYIEDKYIFIPRYLSSVDRTSTELKLPASTDLTNWTDLSIPVISCGDSASTSYSSKYIRYIIKSPEGPILFVIMRQSGNYYGNRAIVNSLSDTVDFSAKSDFASYGPDIRACYSNGKFFVWYAISNSTTVYIETYDIATKTWKSNSVSGFHNSISIQDTSNIVYYSGYYWIKIYDQVLYSSNGANWSYDSRIGFKNWSNWLSTAAVVPFGGENRLLISAFDGSSVVNADLTTALVDANSKKLTYIADSVIPVSLATGSFFGMIYSENDMRLYAGDRTPKKIYEIRYNGHDALKLPTISQDSVYTYIKALEE